MHIKIKAYISKESIFCVGGDVSLADEPFVGDNNDQCAFIMRSLHRKRKGSKMYDHTCQSVLKFSYSNLKNGGKVLMKYDMNVYYSGLILI